MARVLQEVVPSAIRERYARKWGLFFLVVGVVVAVCGLGVAGGIAGEVRTDVDEQLATLATQEARSVAAWDEHNRQLTGTIARTVGEREVDGGTLEAVADAEGVYSVQVVDTENATLVASSGDGEPGTAFSQVTNASGLDQRFATLSGTTPGDRVLRTASYRAGNTPVLTYVARSSERRGVLVTVRLAAFGATLYSATNSEWDSERTTIVLDSEGRVLFDDVRFGVDNEQFQRSYDGTIPDGRSSGAVRYPASAAGTLLTSEYNFQTQPYVVGYARAEVGDANWTVLTHATQSDADGTVSLLDSTALYGGTLVGVLLFAGAGVVGARRTTRSIDSLTDQATAVAEEDREQPIETTRSDELGRLGEAIEAMRASFAAELERTTAGQAELEEKKERLEAEVETLEQTAAEYCTVIGQAADGDLTVRATTDVDSEEMAAMGAEFNEMLADIEETVGRLAAFADNVATSSQEVTASSQEVRSASQQVTESIQQISQGARRQNAALESASSEMEELSTTTGEIASSSNQVADLAEQTARTGLEARESAQSAIAGMSEIETESEQAVAEIRRLEEAVAQIDDLIASIAEIADQTNMLALNANIEASRAQENTDGEGFGVVAEEVKELSNDAKEAAEEIEQRLEGIREQTERTAAQVESTSDIVGDASSYVEEAVDALERIAQFAKQTNDGVQEISAATQQQAASTQQVSSVVDEATKISARTTNEAERVAAAAQEQTTSLTEVTESAEQLADQAAELSDALDRFDVAEADADSVGPGSPSHEQAAESASESAVGDAASTEAESEPEPAADEVDAADSVDFSGGAEEDD